MSAGRRQPRPAGDAVRALADRLAPASTLGDVQRVWDGVVGPTVAAVATPTAEARGTLTVTCTSAVWAQELDLMATGLVERLNAALGRRPDRRSAVPIGARKELVARADVAVPEILPGTGSNSAVLQDFCNEVGGRFDARSCYPLMNHCRLPRPGF